MSRSPLVLTDRGLKAPAYFHCPARRASQSASFIADTGAEVTLLSWKDAETLGIDCEGLQRSLFTSTAYFFEYPLWRLYVS